MTYVLCFALILVSFLVMLNGFLEGAKKTQIDAVLSILLIGLVALSFFLVGLKFGLLAIALTVVSAIVTRPFAAKLASMLLRKK